MSASKARGTESSEVPRTIRHLTPEERAAHGKAARGKAPRSAHAGWAPPSGRVDPISLLEGQAVTREPTLVPIRYGRMLASPFAFYRGAALIMATDLASTPRSDLMVQVCGDAHMSNFGVFASPERALVFDINDFDETHPGPWEWDVKRLTASLAIAGRNNGFSAKERASIVLAAAASYRTAMAGFAQMGNLDVWYARVTVQEGLPQLRTLLDDKSFRQAEKMVGKARTKDSLQALAKLAHIVDGVPRIINDPPLVVPIEELLPPDAADQYQEAIARVIRSYRGTLQPDRRHLMEDFHFVHLARKVVGVGSVGTRAYIVLMVGRDTADPLFMQVKEAQPSVLHGLVGKTPYTHQGQRVVEGQRLMQAASDMFLGWDRAMGIDGAHRDFYMRQLRDWKGSWPPETMSPNAMVIFGRLCAWTLARAHARSGDRVAIAAYLGKSDSFDRAIGEFAEAYADQNEQDYAALQEAVRIGRLTAQTGV